MKVEGKWDIKLLCPVACCKEFVDKEEVWVRLVFFIHQIETNDEIWICRSLVHGFIQVLDDFLPGSRAARGEYVFNLKYRIITLYLFYDFPTPNITSSLAIL